jgi:hypothetical protein
MVIQAEPRPCLRISLSGTAVHLQITISQAQGRMSCAVNPAIDRCSDVQAAMKGLNNWRNCHDACLCADHDASTQTDWPSRQLLLRCSRPKFPTRFCRLHPWKRKSCIHAVVASRRNNELRAGMRSQTDCSCWEKVASRRLATCTARLVKATSLHIATQHMWRTF